MIKPLRIAVADDEPVVRDYFRRILPLMGHEVVAVAADGAELVECCGQHHPDLIIADVRMPGMDGDDAVRQICLEHPVPFILVSAYSKPACVPGDVSAVRWEYLTKPIKRDHLEAAIGRLFGANGSKTPPPCE
jgi:two-component system, response regulator PdtaR